MRSALGPGHSGLQLLGNKVLELRLAIGPIYSVFVYTVSVLQELLQNACWIDHPCTMGPENARAGGWELELEAVAFDVREPYDS